MNALFQPLFRTDTSFAPLVVRVALGTVILPHGLQKLFGWFGGYGFNPTMDYFTSGLGLPWLVGFLVIIAESFGALALIAGFLTRAAACGIGTVMVGAAWIAHRSHFFMDWSGQQGAQGFQFHLLAIGMALALVLTGGGRWSVDGYLARQRR